MAAYSSLPVRHVDEETADPEGLRHQSSRPVKDNKKLISFFTTVVIFFGLSAVTFLQQRATSCDLLDLGYICRPRLSHSLGQYSPFFQVPSEISASVPDGCRVTLVQVLSRHGARYPTTSAASRYNQSTSKLRKVHSFPAKYQFLQTYKYKLGEEDLTDFGHQEMSFSGQLLVLRYPDLVKRSIPFLRAPDKKRVVDSALLWAEGYRTARSAITESSSANTTIPLLSIPEMPGSNNTLSHGLCTNFENGSLALIGAQARLEFAEAFVPTIQRRLNEELPGAQLDLDDVLSFMELCPFETVADPDGLISPLCDLFSLDEYRSYDHYASLGKFYAFGPGNPLGTTQGVGFVNELIARLNGSRVLDSTTTNRSLDNDPATFPLDRSIYVDFTHDTVMTSILFAMNIYDETPLLSKTTVQSKRETAGYSSAWTVPFAGRVYVEKMTCSGHADDLVRVIVNGRTMPLTSCGGDNHGRCRLADFLDGLSFARGNGRWQDCFGD